MPRKMFNAPDDQPLIVLKRDLGGGMNNRQHPQMIADNQAVLLQNIMLETAGQTSIRTGQTLIDSDFPPIYLLDEQGNILLDENKVPLLQEGQTG
jgi:hypothetical protein